MTLPSDLLRSGLYQEVWLEPIKTVALRYGISDVALAKICRKHGIPVPQRGHWAKLQAGKPVFVPKLPSRGLGMPERIEPGRHRHGGLWISDEDLIDAEIPPPVEFIESVETLAARVTKLVGKVARVRDLNAPHHLIAGLLKRDEERRKKYSYYADRPLFASPFEQRRLRILCALYAGLGRCGMRGTLGGNDPSDFGVYVGEQHVSFSLDHPKQQARTGYRYGDDLQRPASDTLKLKVAFPAEEVGDLRTVWEDQPGDAVEAHLADIVVTLIVCGELRYRLSEQHRHQWLTNRKAHAIEEVRRCKEEEERTARERRIKAEKARVDRLLAEAHALRQASDIRAYVDRVRSIESTPTAASQLDACAGWALAQADRIDPVRSGAYLAKFEDEVAG